MTDPVLTDPVAANPLTAWLTTSRREPLDLPGAPARLYIRELLAGDLLAMPSDPEQAQPAIVAACLVDETGQAVLSREQVALLPRAHYQAIIEAVNRLNGWGSAQIEAAAGE